MAAHAATAGTPARERGATVPARRGRHRAARRHGFRLRASKPVDTRLPIANPDQVANLLLGFAPTNPTGTEKRLSK